MEGEGGVQSAYYTHHSDLFGARLSLKRSGGSEVKGDGGGEGGGDGRRCLYRL